MKKFVALFVFVALAAFVGAQQGRLSDQELKALGMSAKSVSDHARLAAHYTAHAVEHETDAAIHEELANRWAKTAPALAGEARHYAAHSREAAEALRSLATLQLGATGTN
jgi:hypothetical protein